MHEVDILLIEDNELDVIAFQRGLKKHRIVNPVVVAENGREALEILRGEHADKQLGTQYVVFLDLNMPVMNGNEFLEAVSEDENLDTSKIFVLTTSSHESDLMGAYQHQVAGYILKSNLSEACGNLHELMPSYWRVVVVPE